MYELIAITVAKTVSEHTKVISLLAKTVAVLTEFYSALNPTPAKEDK